MNQISSNMDHVDVIVTRKRWERIVAPYAVLVNIDTYTCICKRAIKRSLISSHTTLDESNMPLRPHTSALLPPPLQQITSKSHVHDSNPKLIHITRRRVIKKPITL